jgi:hypothetical protein
MKKKLGLSILLVAVLLTSGCGGNSRTTIKGKVTVAGKGPLTGGNITFVLASNQAVNGGGVINADGSYEVVTAPLGECKVLIDNSHLNTAAKNKGMPMVPGTPGTGGVSKAPKDTESKMTTPPKGLKDAPPGVGAGKLNYMKIDDQFSKFESTPLKSTVGSGSATPADFEVK